MAVKKSKGDDQNTPPDVVSLREVGGSMAPLWKNMIESGKTQVRANNDGYGNLITLQAWPAIA